MKVLTYKKIAEIMSSYGITDETRIVFFVDGSWDELDGITWNRAHRDVALLCDVALLKSIVRVAIDKDLDETMEEFFSKDSED